MNLLGIYARRLRREAKEDSKLNISNFKLEEKCLDCDARRRPALAARTHDSRVAMETEARGSPLPSLLRASGMTGRSWE